MVTKQSENNGQSIHGYGALSTSTEALVVAARQRGDNSLQTGRYVITYGDERLEEGVKSLSANNFRVADARDFPSQATDFTKMGDAEALVLPALGVAIIGGEALAAREMTSLGDLREVSGAEIIEPEYFAFAIDEDNARNYSAAVGEATVNAMKNLSSSEFDLNALESTWGLNACKVPQGGYTGEGINIAVLDTGLDLSHPDFSGRAIVTETFVGQPVHDGNGHGTHCIGTACGPLSPLSGVARYGIAFEAKIYAGKVLTDSGSGTTAGVLAGMNWAITNGCEIISMSLGSSAPVQAAYTRAGAIALANGCLIVAAAGNSYGAPTGSPANSPTIMAVASLDSTMMRSNFSDKGKIEISAPGRDIFSSWPNPRQYNTLSGTSMATPHVAGCGALWAQSDVMFRGKQLWDQLISHAMPLTQTPAEVGAGIVQVP